MWRHKTRIYNRSDLKAPQLILFRKITTSPARLRNHLAFDIQRIQWIQVSIALLSHNLSIHYFSRHKYETPRLLRVPFMLPPRFIFHLNFRLSFHTTRVGCFFLHIFYYFLIDPLNSDLINTRLLNFSAYIRKARF